GPPMPAQLRREIAQLELRQQTQVLPVAEENALLDHLRGLRRGLEEAEKAAGVRAAAEVTRGAQEASFQALRAEFEELGRAMDRLRTERDQRMGAIRSQLLTVGQEISEIREKARLRAELFRKVDEISRQMVELDREVRDALVASHARRQEARDTVRDYNRTAREATSGSAAAAQTAEENLANLLKGGKVVLSG
ncbi:MAG: coiled-coil domain-containing protein, partial [Thermoplasmata archaeon]